MRNAHQMTNVKIMQQTQFSAGIHAVTELINNHPELIDYCVILKPSPNHRLQQCIDLMKANKISLSAQPPKSIIQQLASLQHQGIIAIYKPMQHNELMPFVKSLGNKLKLVVLDGVQDPRNLGSCIRTICANNCHGIVIPKNNSASINETVTKVACGACAILPIFPVSNIHQTLTALKQQGVWCYGLTEHATDTLTDIEFSGATALIFGTEDKGLRALTKKSCDHLIKIPTNPAFPSLNLAVSVGIASFELNKQLI
jgi:23S rRNA (guanosine2251-2'-O)-methyltransferase